jgi:hypothetical protein
MDKIVIWAQGGGSVARWPKFWAKSSKRAGEKVAERIRGRILTNLQERIRRKFSKGVPYFPVMTDTQRQR